jgi:geranylgeranyl reductase family protein
MIDVAIIGAGPAGATCAYNLAQKGISTSLFDYSHPREKPCGGMLGSHAKEYFSILAKFPVLHSKISSVQLISPSQVKWTIDISKSKLLGFSRLKFDQYLLDQAIKEGTNFISKKVVRLEKKHSSWRISTQEHSYEARVIVGADGVNSLVRKSILGSLNKSDLGATFGYNFKGAKTKSLIMKFLPDSAGYIWVVPRGDHTNIGGGTSDISRFRELKNAVSMFVKIWYPELEKTSEWAALIPNVKNPKALSPIAGFNWILIGDAAGHVDPISGSGIGYAMLDGEMAAEAIVKGDFEQYPKQWAQNYGKELLLKTRISGVIYKRPLLELYCVYMKLLNYMPFA